MKPIKKVLFLGLAFSLMGCEETDNNLKEISANQSMQIESLRSTKGSVSSVTPSLIQQKDLNQETEHDESKAIMLNEPTSELSIDFKINAEEYDMESLDGLSISLNFLTQKTVKNDIRTEIHIFDIKKNKWNLIGNDYESKLNIYSSLKFFSAETSNLVSSDGIVKIKVGTNVNVSLDYIAVLANPTDRFSNLIGEKVEPTPTPGDGSWWKPKLENFQIVHISDVSNPWSSSFIRPETKIVNTELDQLSEEFVSEAHQRGIKVVAYFSASYERWRADQGRYPADAKGKKMDDWDELWGDFTKVSLQNFLEARMKRAKEMGADAIEIDNTDIAWNDVGFSVSAGENIDALKELARRAHKLGLAIFLKNTGMIALDLHEDYDGVFNEQCNYYNECGDFNPFIEAGKPLFILEYSASSCRGFEGSIVQKKSGYFSKDYKLCN